MRSSSRQQQKKSGEAKQADQHPPRTRSRGSAAEAVAEARSTAPNSG